LWAVVTVLVALIGAATPVIVALVGQRPPGGPGENRQQTNAAQPAPTPPTAVSQPPATPPRQEPPPPKTTAEKFALTRGTLEMTATAVDAHRVRFEFVARDFGNDTSPISDWLNQNQGVFRRKLEELGLGSGTWRQTGLTWPPHVSDGVVTFDVTFESR
jgi:hypothetical protein